MKKILVVDDEKPIREMLRKFLSRKGYEVFDADNGEDALKLVAEQSPHIVLLDIRMPKCDGVEILKRICLCGHVGYMKYVMDRCYFDEWDMKNVIGEMCYVIKHHDNVAGVYDVIDFLIKLELDIDCPCCRKHISLHVGNGVDKLCDDIDKMII